MTAITDKANLEYRDMASPGSTVPNDPDKLGIRQLFALIDIALASLGVNGAITVKKATRALLFADLAHIADTLGVVYNDATPAYNGIYSKVGGSGSGSWSLTALALPASFSADLAEVLAATEAVDAAVLAAEAARDASQGFAEDSAAALDASEVALAGLGIDQFFDTKAAANAGTIANGELILVWADESQGGARTFYVKEAGVLVFKAQVGAPSRYHSSAGNVFYGSLAPLLNNTPAGTKNGDINTGFGFGNMPNATSAYACSTFGYAAGNAITTGHSNTLIGYQSGLAITTGIMNTLVGVDAGFISTAMNRSVILGHHCVNTGNYTGTGLVAIGQQTARPLTEGDDHIVIGRNSQANAPATGSGQSVIVGCNSALATAVVTSVVIGKDIMQSSGAGTRTITDCYLAGYRALFGVRSSTDDCILGPYALFQADGSTVDSVGNTAFGGRAGYLVSSTNCLFMGYRAAAKTVSGSLTGVVALGYRAGDTAGGGTALVNNDFVLANSEADASRLIWGNFATGNVNVQNDLTIGGDTLKVTTARTPASATAAGTAGEICWDASYIYVCTATDTWKRVAIATW